MARFSLIGNKADRILGMTAAAVAATTGAGLVEAPQAAADIVYSGVVNIPIPDDIDGVYMNLVTGANAAAPPAGWDINPYSATAGGFNLWGFTTTTWYNPSGVIGNGAGYVLPFGQLISSADNVNFFRPGGGTNVGTSVALNAANLFGVRFSEATVNGGADIYGWVEITFGASAGSRAITGYAYETSGGGIGAGAIPEPGSFAALAFGALGLFGRRRRVA